MSRYQELRQRALGVAFLLGPILFIAAALVFVMGVNLNPDGVGSRTEGLLGFYGAILFIPIYLELARMLGERRPVFGLITTVTGLLGASAAVVAYFDRIQRATLVAAGVDAALYETIINTMIPETLATGLNALLFPLTSILLGIGLLAGNAMPKWAAIALLVAGLCFVAAQATETAFGLRVLYPLACVLWLVVLAPIGLRYLSGSVGNAVPAPSQVAAKHA
jgi:hypothetical protein